VTNVTQVDSVLLPQQFVQLHLLNFYNLTANFIQLISVKHVGSSFERFQQTRKPSNKQLHGKPATGVNTYSITEPV